MKNLILKYKYILMPIFLIAGSVATVLVIDINIKPKLKSSCNGSDVSLELSKNSADAMPQAEDRNSADLVIKGSVCEIIKVHSDGDKLRQDVIDEYGDTKGVTGVSYTNSTDIRVRVNQIIKGDYSGESIIVSINGRRGDKFSVGDTGTFFIKKYDGTKYRMLGNTFTSGD